MFVWAGPAVSGRHLRAQKITEYGHFDITFQLTEGRTGTRHGLGDRDPPAPFEFGALKKHSPLDIGSVKRKIGGEQAAFEFA
ncbi:hypothetical protein EVAR_50639_1 [Eumeta japonica]|uniref:Uncharacterized protein n=1 Tax=Eumeta variegata TaxID=151549 RepID=A0A4C1XI88_EUMVA|nr:hypothetical protein EVAR_50639_1 [Eumeta japonica]